MSDWTVSCRPILYRSLEVSYSSNLRVLTYILPSLAVSVLLNIPKVCPSNRESANVECLFHSQYVSEKYHKWVFIEVPGGQIWILWVRGRQQSVGVDSDLQRDQSSVRLSQSCLRNLNSSVLKVTKVLVSSQYAQCSTSLSKLRKNIIKFLLLLLMLFALIKHYNSLFRVFEHSWNGVYLFNKSKLIFLFRVNPAYMYYYIHWTRLLCTGIIPFSYLSYMNLRIYTRMRQTSLSTVRSRSSSTKKASNLAAVLIVIGCTLSY